MPADARRSHWRGAGRAGGPAQIAVAFVADAARRIADGSRGGAPRARLTAALTSVRLAGGRRTGASALVGGRALHAASRRAGRQRRARAGERGSRAVVTVAADAGVGQRIAYGRVGRAFGARDATAGAQGGVAGRR